MGEGLEAEQAAPLHLLSVCSFAISFPWAPFTAPLGVFYQIWTEGSRWWGGGSLCTSRGWSCSPAHHPALCLQPPPYFGPYRTDTGSPCGKHLPWIQILVQPPHELCEFKQISSPLQACLLICDMRSGLNPWFPNLEALEWSQEI